MSWIDDFKKVAKEMNDTFKNVGIPIEQRDIIEDVNKFILLFCGCGGKSYISKVKEPVKVKCPYCNKEAIAKRGKILTDEMTIGEHAYFSDEQAFYYLCELDKDISLYCSKHTNIVYAGQKYGKVIDDLTKVTIVPFYSSAGNLQSYDKVNKKLIEIVK